MYLTDEEKRMLDGEEGPAVQASMQLLTKLGEVYDAKRLVPVHLVFGTMVGSFGQFADVDADMEKKFATADAKVRTVTMDHIGLNTDNWEELWSITEKQAANHQKYLNLKMGVILARSCIPYFHGMVPRLGEAVCWMESSAIIFANSVLGARCNRISHGVPLASALTGRIPEFGLLLDENRGGDILVRMEYQPKSLFDYNTLGYVIGKIAPGKVPVIDGLPSWTHANHHKFMGAAQATKGGIALYHAIGITPEARTRKEAFRGRKPEFEVVIKESEIRTAIEEMNRSRGDKIDAVFIGCPHPTVEEIRELAELLEGKKVKDTIKFFINIDPHVADWSRQLGYLNLIEDSGAKLVVGECVLNGIPASVSRQWKTIATNSAKYAIGINRDPAYHGAVYTDTKGCVDLATKGK